MSVMAPEAERIDVRGLSKTFQLAGTAIEAVRDVSFSVRRGEFVALLGPSGSGKSTVLNMIATLIRPSGGQIMIDGAPVMAGKATSGVIKDSINMPRYTTAEVDFVADHPGPTLFHCHHQDHMDEGLMGLIRYA